MEPAGWETEEILRIEAGLPAMGQEIVERTNPLEVGLEGAISFDKGCYTGQEVVARLRTYDKVQRRLHPLVIPGHGKAAPGDVLQVDGRDAGTITSVIISPLRERAIALGLIRRDFLTQAKPFTVGDSIAVLRTDSREYPESGETMS